METSVTFPPAPAPSVQTSKPARLPGQPAPNNAGAPGAPAPKEPQSAPKAPQPVQTHTELRVDKSIDRVVSTSVDENTGERISEIPAKGLRRLYAAMRVANGPIVDEKA